MNAPSKSARIAALLALAALPAGACVSHQHTVGLGATGAGAVTARQFYLFFGLVQVNEVDSQRMAPELTSYTVDTRFSLVDLVLAPLLLPLTVTSRTVEVRT